MDFGPGRQGQPSTLPSPAVAPLAASPALDQVCDINDLNVMLRCALAPATRLITRKASHGCIHLMLSSEAMHCWKANLTCQHADLVSTHIHKAWKQALSRAGQQMTLSDSPCCVQEHVQAGS